MSKMIISLLKIKIISMINLRLIKKTIAIKSPCKINSLKTIKTHGPLLNLNKKKSIIKKA
jgi:hypothetical protein